MKIVGFLLFLVIMQSSHGFLQSWRTINALGFGIGSRNLSKYQWKRTVVTFAHSPKKSTASKKKTFVQAPKPKEKATKALPHIKPEDFPTIDPSDVSEEQFKLATKTLKKLFLPKRIYEITDSCLNHGTLTLGMLNIALIQLQGGERADLALPLFHKFLQQENAKQAMQANLTLSGSLVLSLCKLGCIKEANSIANLSGIAKFVRDCTEISLATSSSSPGPLSNFTDIERKKWEASALIYLEMLNNLAFGFLKAEKYKPALKLLETLSSLPLFSFSSSSSSGQKKAVLVSKETAQEMLKTVLHEGDVPRIIEVIALLRRCQSLNDLESNQLLTSHMMKSVEFIKGAVDIEGLPQQKYPEIPEMLFMGRSNVGKSSLINMITNRKKLAYISKTPGKTTEFNYYLCKGQLGKEKTKQDFYLIDLPGVGFARRSKELREKWLSFMKSFIENRAKTLKCVFHLIDSRHGILDSDYDCLDLLPLLPRNIEYIVVFTKVDKNSGGGGTGSGGNSSLLYYQGVSRQIIHQTQTELTRLAGEKREIPILFSSSEARTGAVDILSKILVKMNNDKQEEREREIDEKNRREEQINAKNEQEADSEPEEEKEEKGNEEHEEDDESEERKKR
jgi:GTP-binding protein